MKALWRAFRLIWQATPLAMLRDAGMSTLVLIMGAALLGLSGWFITATGVAGLAGIGIAFDVFRPSAGVRLLALGRAGARYFERLMSHDATLRALAVLRVTLLQRLARWPIPRLRHLRGASALTRITADVDALDGVALRLALPLMAALTTHVMVFLVLSWLVTMQVAAVILVGYLLGGAIVLMRVTFATLAPSTEAEEAMQRLRRQAIGLFRGQRDVILQGELPAIRTALDGAEVEARAALERLDRVDTGAGFWMQVSIAGIVSVVLGLSGWLVTQGAVDAAPAAIGVFVALSLAESLLPLRRGVAEVGRIRDAVGRVLDGSESDALPVVKTTPKADAGQGISVTDLCINRPGGGLLLQGLSFHVAPGETMAFVGTSGSGKSTLLDVLAGVGTAAGGAVRIGGVDLADWPEDDLRRWLTLLPQRSALVSGSLRENLSLARADVTDADALAVLEACALTGVVEGRGGLGAILGEGGAGLSGGEARRLVLARALLRRPNVLLLDEPTEGLDAQTARAVLRGIRNYLPDAAILVAAHRPAEQEFADRLVTVEK
ncbi:ATP-binding cassette domain-containing protein [Mesobacterium sp. TK19101]|uniref:ATP-binding cassette domain-containing protein n=1 Tax=Mesobacterium hydrothermale TaxID=3111907 RepID=A0ABU6HGH0_9RHOB|nr:ATP-binding cassette domain-containing protein [Mesobacterium sp. TK19101]MEC3861553.1 ATP-binding cassette domain-containing protein [Mesobacterium sp. TK19101]